METDGSKPMISFGLAHSPTQPTSLILPELNSRVGGNFAFGLNQKNLNYDEMSDIQRFDGNRHQSFIESEMGMSGK